MPPVNRNDPKALRDFYVQGFGFEQCYESATGSFMVTDGLFNLGSALSFVQVLPTGVYIAMNGRCFNWDRVRKNRDTGTFEDI